MRVWVIAAIILFGGTAQAAESPSPSRWWWSVDCFLRQPYPCCPDDYCKKAQPLVACPDRACVADDYCKKQLPSCPSPPSHWWPCDYAVKPFPVLKPWCAGPTSTCGPAGCCPATHRGLDFLRETLGK